MERGAVWAVAVPLLLFKVWFAILLLSYAPTREGFTWVAITHWPLLIVVGLLVGPGIAAFRLLKVRRRREQLRRAEWMLEPTPRVQCSVLWETVARLEGDDSPLG